MLFMHMVDKRTRGELRGDSATRSEEDDGATLAAGWAILYEASEERSGGEPRRRRER